ncbi:hypothetical protein [Streptomyces sp. NPDC059371]|uniref:hypothetical protein n=1 Tax=Streptomyces sp. NPDC059371 TaxID=3346812 RepID=UPI0036A7DEC6
MATFHSAAATFFPVLLRDRAAAAPTLSLADEDMAQDHFPRLPCGAAGMHRAGRARPAGIGSRVVPAQNRRRRTDAGRSGDHLHHHEREGYLRVTPHPREETRTP